MARFEGHAIKQQAGARDAKQESLLSLGKGRQKLIPGGLELQFCPLVVETVEPDVLQQDIEAVDEGLGRSDFRGRFELIGDDGGRSCARLSVRRRDSEEEVT
jgi:hypothetical protein